MLQQGAILPELGGPDHFASRDDHLAADRLGKAGAGGQAADAGRVGGEEGRGAKPAYRVGHHAVNGTVRIAE